MLSMYLTLVYILSSHGKRVWIRSNFVQGKELFILLIVLMQFPNESQLVVITKLATISQVAQSLTTNSVCCSFHLVTVLLLPLVSFQLSGRPAMHQV